MFTPDDVENFHHPSRRPWLVVVVLIVISLTGWLLFQYFENRKNHAPQQEPPEPKVEAPSAAPAGAVSNSLAAAVQSDPTGSVSVVSQAVQQVVQDIGPELDKARVLDDAGELVKARKAYLALIKKASGPALAEIEHKLGAVNTKLVTAPVAMPEKVAYIVKQGDSVEKIAKSHGVTSESITTGNKLANANIIGKGDRLLVLPGKYRILVSKSANTLTLFFNDEFFKKYLVGTGKLGKTPVGTFAVRDKIPEPPWTKDGRIYPYGHKENILGTRWMSIKATGTTPEVSGYGIHGTWDDSSIGKAESAGCVRMKNPEVEELYNWVPLHTPVVIVE